MTVTLREHVAGKATGRAVDVTLDADGYPDRGSLRDAADSLGSVVFPGPSGCVLVGFSGGIETIWRAEESFPVEVTR